ncbi:MAG: hypothetical protein GX619_00475 [Bacteroidales bacterium]|nr:hypothetical protein [Bacteroidales bacterium]
MTILVVALFFMACQTEDQPQIVVKPTGKIAFHTNAVGLLFSDSTRIEVYVDSAFIGTLTGDCHTIGLADTLSSDSVLVIDRPAGTYEYVAITFHSDSLVWRGTITLTSDTLQATYLDVMDVADELLKTRIRLVGVWTRIEFPYRSVEFTKNDFVYEVSTSTKYPPYVVAGTYHVLTPDSIETFRPYRVVHMKHKIVFNGNDSLVIMRFVFTTVAVPYPANMQTAYLVRKNDL